MTDASRSRYSPSDPSDYTRPVGTVSQALDDLAENAGGGGVTDHGALTGLGDDDHTQYLLGPVDLYSTAGFVVATDGTDREVRQTGVSADSSGNMSSGGGDISTNGGNVVTGPGLVDGRDVSADGSKLDGIESGATADQTDAEILAAWESESGRDASVDGSKLDGIEANADVTDATNVAAAGAAMDSDFTAAGVMVRLASAGSYATRTLNGGTGINVTNGKGTSGDPEVAIDSTVIQQSDFSTGIVAFNGAFGTFSGRSIAGGDGVSVSNANGTTGNPTISVEDAQIVAVTFGNGPSNNAALVPLYPPHVDAPANTEQRGITVPFACSLVGYYMQANITSAGGGPAWGAYFWKNGSLLVIDTATWSGSTGANQYQSATWSPGTHTLASGDTLSVDRLRSGGFALTTEDVVCTAFLLVDGFFDGS